MYLSQSRPADFRVGPPNPCWQAQRAICQDCSARERSVCSGIGPDDAARAELAQAARTVSFAERTRLVSEGDPADAFFSLTEGCAKVSKILPNGRQQIVGFLLSGDFVGLAIDRVYTYSVEAVTKVRACRFPRASLFALLAHHRGMERRLREVANHELAIAQEQMLALGRKTAIERVAGFLLQLSERAQRIGLEADPIDLPMNRAEIADYLGLTIETVSRTLSRLRRSGCIALESGATRIALTDRSALQSLAEGWDASA